MNCTIMEASEGLWKAFVLHHTQIGVMEKFGICSQRCSELFLIIILLFSIGNAPHLWNLRRGISPSLARA
jgi:hypothetical protein